MTISTFSSARLGPLAALALLALCPACGKADSVPTEAETARSTPTAAPRAGGGKAAPGETLAQLYTADLAQAVAGVKKAPFGGTGGFGGMACTPGSIGGDARDLTLDLPEDAGLRRHVLAVVTPERGLLEVYSPYDDDAEADDLIIPSETISWARARTEHRFATSSDALDGLHPGLDHPEALFIEAGRYRFALVNGIDRELLKANKTPVVVYAACSFDWVP